MSNFPIIPTTPPPIDSNDSEEEEDFEAFNGILGADDEKDIEFDVKDNEDIDKRVSLPEGNTNDDSSGEDNGCQRLDARSDNSIEMNANICNDFLKQDIHCLNSEELSDIKDNELDLKESNLKDSDLDLVKESDDYKNNDLSSEEWNHYQCLNEDNEELDFADFTSFKSNEENDVQKDEQRLSFNVLKPETSFGDFDTNCGVNLDAMNGSMSIENNFNDEKSDDDFADFASAQPLIRSQLQTVSNKKTNSSSLQEFDENESEFADFSSFQDNYATNESINNSTIASNVSSDEGSHKLDQLFAQLFPHSDVDNNSLNISRDLLNGCEQNRNLWRNLQDLETAPSLKLRWSNSHSFEVLLAALNIDRRNILNPSMPVFASGLGGLGCVLEPTKPKVNDLNEESIPENELSDNTLSASIPPVQFDWSSSGLTNPLDANQKSMVSFDLDFFVTNDDVKNTNKQTVFSRFEELLNDKNEKNCENNANETNLIQHILTTVGTTSSATDMRSMSDQMLSPSALQVLDELPNISYMTANVLMFPLINQKIDYKTN